MEKYELWLDESGDFRPESQVRKGRFPSLVGGVLLKAGSISSQDLKKIVSQGIIDPFDAHGMDFDDSLKRKIMLPALQQTLQKGGRLVYFENKERITSYSHRELYLRLLASGITQLAQVLGSEDPEFTMSIIIAQKGVPKEDLTYEERQNHNVKEGYSTALLEKPEIKDELIHYIRQEWNRGQFDVESRASLDFIICDARKDLRLKLADYASNVRITRNSAAFSGEYRDPLLRLFENAYVFSVYPRTTENEINRDLSAGNLGRALMQLYLDRGDLDHKKMLERILNRFKDASYRIGKIQLSFFADSMVDYARNETDFEEVEDTLKRVLHEVFSEENRAKIPYQSELGEYKVRLFLTDMYLREGDLESAKNELEKLQAVIFRMNYRIENLKFLYFYLDKKALYFIDCMDYSKAIETLNISIRTIEKIQGDLMDNDDVVRYFSGEGNRKEGKLNSEYLGNVLCMKIYAEMFMQRSHPEMYDEMVKDSDYAFSQYEYAGELERNLQYRAHIEMEHGDYRTALQWLLKTRDIELNPDEDIVPWCLTYLDEAMNEDPLSRTYYLMYYVEIMYEAERGGEADFASEMYDAINRSKEIYRMFFTGWLHDGQKKSYTEDLMDSATGDQTLLYHPIEIVWWKWGAYQYMSRKEQVKGMRFMDLALRKCRQSTNQSYYLSTMVTALAIELEQIALQLRYKLSMKTDGKIEAEHDMNIQALVKDLKNSTKQLLKNWLPEHMKEYINRVQEFTEKMINLTSYDDQSANEADQISREITY